MSSFALLSVSHSLTFLWIFYPNYFHPFYLLTIIALLQTNYHELEAGASKVRWWIGIAAQGLMGTGRCGWGVEAIGARAEDTTAAEDDDADETTRLHEGHMVRVVGGFMCM